MKIRIPVFIAFFLFSLGLGAWFLFSSFSQNPVEVLATPEQEKIPEGAKSDTQEEWFHIMADGKSETFQYPVSEMGLVYESDPDLRPMRVFVDDLNEYRFYCINQLLLESKIEYAYYKTNSIIRLVIFLNDPNTQKKILQDFDYYKIQYITK